MWAISPWDTFQQFCWKEEDTLSIKEYNFLMAKRCFYSVTFHHFLFFFWVLDEKEVEFEADVMIVLVMILILKMAFVTSLHPKRLPIMSLQILKYHRAWQSYYLRGYKYFKLMREEINIMHLKTHLWIFISVKETFQFFFAFWCMRQSRRWNCFFYPTSTEKNVIKACGREYKISFLLWKE